MQDCRLKKIVFISPSSGAFLQHHFALAKVAALKMEAHAILNLDKPGDSNTIQNGGIIVHSANLSRGSVNPFRIVKEAVAVRSAIGRIAPDIVNPINLKSVVVTAIARMGMDCGLVGTITGLGYMFTGDTFRQKILRNLSAWGLALALPSKRHILVFSNDDDRRELLSRGVSSEGSSIVVRVPGIDTGEFEWTPEPEEGFRVVLPARMLWDKGVGEFVEAAKYLREEIPEAEFILAGCIDPDNPAHVEEGQLEYWHREGIITWLGHCADMPSLLGTCHVVCLPSAYREGFPRVLAEAMSCGRAIIATDMPGCRDAVSQSLGGLLIPPRNAQALTDALLYMYDHPEERRLMASRGRRWAERELSIGDITSTLLRIVTNLVMSA